MAVFRHELKGGRQGAFIVYVSHSEDGIGNCVSGHIHRESEIIRGVDAEHSGSVIKVPVVERMSMIATPFTV